MSIGRSELAHNSPEQVAEYLRRALDLVEELDPPADLRPLVFAKAVDLVSAKSIQFEQVTALPGGLVAPRGL